MSRAFLPAALFSSVHATALRGSGRCELRPGFVVAVVKDSANEAVCHSIARKCACKAKPFCKWVQGLEQGLEGEDATVTATQSTGAHAGSGDDQDPKDQNKVTKRSTPPTTTRSRPPGHHSSPPALHSTHKTAGHRKQPSPAKHTTTTTVTTAGSGNTPAHDMTTATTSTTAGNGNIPARDTTTTASDVRPVDPPTSGKAIVSDGNAWKDLWYSTTNKQADVSSEGLPITATDPDCTGCTCATSLPEPQFSKCDKGSWQEASECEYQCVSGATASKCKCAAEFGNSKAAVAAILTGGSNRCKGQESKLITAAGTNTAILHGSYGEHTFAQGVTKDTQSLATLDYAGFHTKLSKHWKVVGGEALIQLWVAPPGASAAVLMPVALGWAHGLGDPQKAGEATIVYWNGKAALTLGVGAMAWSYEASTNGYFGNYGGGCAIAKMVMLEYDDILDKIVAW